MLDNFEELQHPFLSALPLLRYSWTHLRGRVMQNGGRGLLMVSQAKWATCTLLIAVRSSAHTPCIVWKFLELLRVG